MSTITHITHMSKNRRHPLTMRTIIMLGSLGILVMLMVAAVAGAGILAGGVLASAPPNAPRLHEGLNNGVNQAAKSLESRHNDNGTLNPAHKFSGRPDPCDPVWSAVSSPNVGDRNFLWGVAAVSANDVWAVGDYYNGNNPDQTLVEHWDGTSWSVVPSPNVGTGDNELFGVAVVSANDVWAVGVGSGTLVEHWDGASWSVVPSPNVGTSTNQLNGVAAVSANDVWAVGGYCGSPCFQTLIEHWDGTSWSVVPSPNVGDLLYGVAAVSANDVWAVGHYYNSSAQVMQTLVEHWDGTSWSVIPSPNVGMFDNYLNGVAAVSANDVWTVGSIAQTDLTTVA